MKVLSYLSMFFVVGTATTDTTVLNRSDSTVIVPKVSYMLLADPEEQRKQNTVEFFAIDPRPEM